MSGKIRILFASETPVTPDLLFALQRTRKGGIRFLPEGGIELDLRGKGWAGIFTELKDVMSELDSQLQA